MRYWERLLTAVLTALPWSLAYQLTVGRAWAFACGVGAFGSYRLVIEVVTAWRDPERDQ